MPQDLLNLLNAPWLLIAVLTAGAFIGIAIERLVEGEKRAQRRAYWKGRNQPRGTITSIPGAQQASKSDPLAVASEQLRLVSNAEFSKRYLLNKSEARVLYAAEKAIMDVGLAWRVMAQVSLGEILSSPNTEAYRAINSKRVDLLLINQSGLPLAAIEYQGTGHHQGSAAARDAVKKEALRLAGIQYIEIKAGDKPADLNWAIAKLAAEHSTKVA